MGDFDHIDDPERREELHFNGELSYWFVSDGEISHAASDEGCHGVICPNCNIVYAPDAAKKQIGDVNGV